VLFVWGLRLALAIGPNCVGPPPPPILFSLPEDGSRASSRNVVFLLIFINFCQTAATVQKFLTIQKLKMFQPVCISFSE
jgi:hypothetical protein